MLNTYLNLVSFLIKTTEGMGFSGGSDSKESACNVEDLGSIPGLGRPPGEWLHTPVFWPEEFHGVCIVHGVAKSQTQLSNFYFHDDIMRTYLILNCYYLHFTDVEK